MRTKFFFNPCENLCADELWIAKYLVARGLVESEVEALKSLDFVPDFCGWSVCEVSDTIAELFEYAH